MVSQQMITFTLAILALFFVGVLVALSSGGIDIMNTVLASGSDMLSGYLQ